MPIHINMVVMRDFSMYTDAGNEAVRKMVDRLLNLPLRTNNDQIYDFLRKEMKEIAKTHGEIWDTDVRENIIYCVEREIGRNLSIYF